MWGSFEEFNRQLIIAVLISGLGFICGKIYIKFRSLLYKRTIRFSLDGFWYSCHNNYQEEKIIEVIQLKQNKEDVLVKIIQYKEKRKNMYTFRGKGIFTTDILSFFYYSDNESFKQNGVMTLKLSNHNINEVFMDGTYYEINSEKDKNEGFYPLGTYKVYRLNIPFLKQIDFKMKRGIFSDYRKVKETIKKYGEI